jgi:VanZ family protein
MNSAKHFAWYHLPVILYAAAITAVSSIPDLSTGDIQFIAVDKLAHFLEYSIFAYITFRSFSHIERLRLPTAWLLTMLFITLFAAADEFHQSFVPGRDMDVYDFLVDVGGALLITTLLFLRRRRLQRS